jgi:DNA invertase Pin-like site-specific DNA recombinase
MNCRHAIKEPLPQRSVLGSEILSMEVCMRNKRKNRQEKVLGYRIYLRLSDEDDWHVERRMTIQRDSIQEVILNQTDIPVGREYQDHITKSDEERLALSELLLDAASGKFTHLAVFAPNCLGKNGSEARLILDLLLLFGIKIRFASMPDTKPEAKEDYVPLVLFMDIFDQIGGLFSDD